MTELDRSEGCKHGIAGFCTPCYEEARTVRLEQRIDQLERQLAEAKEDTARLDWLEGEMREEPLLLHNCHSGDEFPQHPRGLGLTPWRPRTLREAIDTARKERG